MRMALDFIFNHFRKYRQMSSPWTFCWKITIERFIVGFVNVLIIIFIFPSIVNKQLSATLFLFVKSPILLIIGVILAPSIETILLQGVPIKIARSLRASFNVQVLVSTIAFAAPHFLTGLATGISAGIVGGFYHSFTYAHWIDKSGWTAFWTTAVAHMLHNLTIFIILLIELWLKL